jgi:hypothetical protein
VLWWSSSRSSAALLQQQDSSCLQCSRSRFIWPAAVTLYEQVTYMPRRLLSTQHTLFKHESTMQHARDSSHVAQLSSKREAAVHAECAVTGRQAACWVGLLRLTARLYLSASVTRGRMVQVVTRLEGDLPQVGSMGCIRHMATFHASTSLWWSTWREGAGGGGSHDHQTPAPWIIPRALHMRHTFLQQCLATLQQTYCRNSVAHADTCLRDASVLLPP